ncbi:LysR family transcriptional regulator [Priestia taiwanensis]|uniref:HTH-type transcriptional regulator GltR n=1 Tax=Priestia taiwanensis TaxID=1347902 RepID=A0A917ERC6_9BACI|nr:LysR family transcriptional regulator [Priestia taiwanensis]MBM7364752.1 DNA-binding transcriptional LysR family regulator [Priestia taiwanensis]GGE79331.1 HTH-type transcriptional regulator GltR [Priestia taiwanensis]
MNEKDLEIFRLVAKHGTVSKAATELNYVQSNVTSRIHKLEIELGTPLFYRSNRGVILTAEGKVFLTYADKLVDLMKEAKEALQNPEMPSGPLCIGATDITTAVHLPSILSAYHHKYPNVDVSLKTGSTEELVESVLNYDIDGAFVTAPVHHPNMEQELLLQEEVVLITHKSQPPFQMMKEWKQRTILVFREGCTYRSKLEQWLRDEGIVSVKKMEFGTMEGIIGCVKAGLGLALISKRIAEQIMEDEHIQVYSVPHTYKDITTVFIRRCDVSMSNALRKFVDVTKEMLQEE